MASYVEHGPERPRQPRKPEKYPPLDGFVVVTNAGWNGGYLCPSARPCKCGGHPKFQQYTFDKSDVAQVFVGLCTKCGRKTRTEGTLEESLDQWNRRQFSYDTELVAGKLKDPAEDGLIMLCNTVIKESIREATDLVKRYHELKALMADPEISASRKDLFAPEMSQVKGNLLKYQNFFETSPLMYERDPESVLSDIRRAVYPELTPEERIKIPLNLVRM